LAVNRPEVYYGELTNDVVFVNSQQDEFNYPQGNDNVYSNYEGIGGIILDSFFKRLLFAFRLGDSNVLLSNDIDNDTRLMLHRQIQERVRRITPFLSLDADPYVVLTDDGRLVWLQDAYTVSNRFPYSEPALWENNRPINYIRNSVKITIDAYDGTINYYITEPDDPIVRTYARVFPEVFQPLNQMPEDLRQHLRYPVDLFATQTKQYLRYHMIDTRVFYNQEDVWQIPLELFTTDGSTNSKIEMEPYYVFMPLPGEVEPEYLLIQPYTPVGKDNMIAWLAARNDVPNYGELLVYELPKQELVFGPLQIESRIDQQTEISQQFSLWDQRGSSVIRGNLLVIPVNNRFLYVEPVYLKSDTSALPELKRVIVATDTRIAMDETLGGALASLLEEEPEDIEEVLREELEVEVEPVAAEVDVGGDTAVEPTPAITPEDSDVNSLIESANAHFVAAQEAQQNGDWTTYGEELEALERDLARLLELSGQTP